MFMFKSQNDKREGDQQDKKESSTPSLYTQKLNITEADLNEKSK